MTQNNLGVALRDLAAHAAGPRAAELLHGLDRLEREANDLRSRLRRSAVVRTFGDLVDQPSPDCREYMVLATARTKDRRLRSREPFVAGSK